MGRGRPRQQRKRRLQRDLADAGALRRQNQPPASAPRRASTIRFLRWQLARHSRKLPPRARGLARTMSAPRLPGTNALAASKSATGNFTPHSALRGQKSPLSPQKNQRRREPKKASASVKHSNVTARRNPRGHFPCVKPNPWVVARKKKAARQLARGP